MQHRRLQERALQESAPQHTAPPLGARRKRLWRGLRGRRKRVAQAAGEERGASLRHRTLLNTVALLRFPLILPVVTRAGRVVAVVSFGARVDVGISG